MLLAETGKKRLSQVRDVQSLMWPQFAGEKASGAGFDAYLPVVSCHSASCKRARFLAAFWSRCCPPRRRTGPAFKSPMHWPRSDAPPASARGHVLCRLI